MRFPGYFFFSFFPSLGEGNLWLDHARCDVTRWRGAERHVTWLLKREAAILHTGATILGENFSWIRENEMPVMPPGFPAKMPVWPAVSLYRGFTPHLATHKVFAITLNECGLLCPIE